MIDDPYKKALDAAAKQLSYRALSQSMLREKLLEKGHAEDAADYAIAWLSERNLLNDDSFAQSIVNTYGRKGYGKMRIRQELTKRGIDAETSASLLQEFESDNDQLVSLLDKKLKGDISDKKQIDKAVAFLQRRGFSWSDIRTALKTYGETLSEQDD